MNQKKGQIQLGESIFVVIIIIVLIIFGMVFASKAQSEGIKNEQQEFKELETITLSQYVSSLTEIQCSLQNVEVTTCYDKTKLEAFRTLTDSVAEQLGKETLKELYFSQLGDAKVYITQVYPEERNVVTGELREWLVYDNQPAVIVNQARADLAVSILDPIEKSFSFATLTIIQYK